MLHATPGDARPLTADSLRFLRQLARNNRKEWFEANRERYDRSLRAPMRALVEELDARLALVVPEIVGDPRRSLFRIYRDVRFSPDKRPYKTNAALWFFHRDAGRQVGTQGSGGAGFYFHLEPRRCFLGGGLWMPAAPQLRQVRDALAEDPEGFEAIVLDPAFRRRFGSLDEESMLTRLPRGYAPGHPAERWLRYRSFTAGRGLPDAQVTESGLPDRLLRDYERLAPFIRWLNAALGFRPASRR